jgi:serine/threonine protein kinase/Tol biopolymer transport system component
MISTKIAHYEIAEKLGEGGMGVVYRAHDTKLNRDVAIKVLPNTLTHDRDRMDRFRREAQLLAQLNHSAIAGIYGVEESNGQYALVMELADGQTLAERLSTGPIPLEETLPIAKQIAEALEAAHERGIIHRDLKPANIKISEDGQVKVLDFGLAKALEGDPSSSVESEHSPTLTMAATQAGVILGTAAYMSPEQARGKTADKRADIWSFGVVLYEMLTGRQMFGGETVSDSLAGVLKTEIDLKALPDETPQAVRRLLSRCLERDRKRRLRDIGDARLEIEEALAGKAEPVLPKAAPAMPRRKVLSLGGAAIFAGGFGAGFWFRRPPAAPELPRRVFSLVATDFPPTGTVISPDGRHVAFRSVENSRVTASLWVWDLDQEQPRRLAGPNRVSNPFWSPDSRFVGFRDGNEIKKVAVAGGAATVICQWEQRNFVGASWSSDGETIVFSSGGTPGLYQVPAAGGSPKPLREGDQYGYVYPQFLPAEAAAPMLFVQAESPQSGEIVFGNPGKGEGATVVAGTAAVYSPSGHILYESQGGIWALPFSLGTGESTGEAFPVRQQAGSPSVSADGTLVYIDTPAAGSQQLLWKSRDGAELGVIGQPQERIRAPRLSPDGKRVAVWGLENGNNDIWIHDAERGLKTRLTFDEAREDRPIWSPDGKQIAFASARSGNVDGYLKSADGSGEPVVLVASEKLDFIVDWSRDGKYMVVTAIGEEGRGIGYLKKNEQSGKYEIVPLIATRFDASDGNLSPDSRWIAYQSNESGRSEVYVQRFPEGGGRLQVSVNGGLQPRWRGDGKELFYVEGETLMVVSVNQGAELSFGKPVALFEQPGITSSPGQQYDVAPDGQKFVVIEAVSEDRPPVMRVVQNWISEFRDR